MWISLGIRKENLHDRDSRGEVKTGKIDEMDQEESGTRINFRAYATFCEALFLRVRFFDRAHEQYRLRVIIGDHAG